MNIFSKRQQNWHSIYQATFPLCACTHRERYIFVLVDIFRFPVLVARFSKDLLESIWGLLECCFLQTRCCPWCWTSIVNHCQCFVRYHCRSVSRPNLPDGPSHALSNNYYHERDARRHCMPEMSVYSATATKAITAGGDQRCSSSF